MVYLLYRHPWRWTLCMFHITFTLCLPSPLRCCLPAIYLERIARGGKSNRSLVVLQPKLGLEPIKYDGI
ncbi:hypothetical protein CKAN_02686900 [Cinnamomum micranthum f. kanehirae]|uniref:Secreted protein n=1 Tax=Cinnamomum micranthum f. kanehirae TaxID=337451 RepID=A0A443Q338_9MAGN|nr:hypothetical protein CKAN_02686900 [Cinnamomum micranthum f. kanehirae]